MSLAGLTLPELSEWDPPATGEGSLDPMGLAAISDRLADQLVPGLRARMQRVRFVTATAVGALACETLLDEISADGISTPSICFEWVVIEAYVRRLTTQQVPRGVPGSQKARVVINRGQRLSAATYLKGPAVFGFNGVYKPFSVDSGVTGRDLEPGPRCAEIVRSWEVEEGFAGFTDQVPGSEGARLRSNIRDRVRDALHAGRCTTNPGSWLFGRLAASLHPDEAGSTERRALRGLFTDSEHDTRAELARLVDPIDDDLSEAEILDAIRASCSGTLGTIIDAVQAYEEFAALVNAGFRTLCSVSFSMGTQPLTAQHVSGSEMIVRCARELPDRFRVAAERMAAIDADANLEERLGEFAVPRDPGEMFELLLSHHEKVQSGKPPQGKRPWFEPFRDGWVVRAPYGTAEQPELGPWFIHPVRVDALRRFLRDTRP